ncbi:hypothetical protein [uncultured Tenacibaculum sp.]|uniref:hypothetical protein n=1 Tax=uncultured Tenacibaculum sp. TaxID=174713 RepID=UPI002610FD07|nr:hypothetical protein [uncultured Tenacibaculum sp.]
MKRFFLITVLGAVLGCTAQQKYDLSSSEVKMNYIFSRMYKEKPLHKDLFNKKLFLAVYKFSDSKISKGNAISETHEFLDSFLISISPDGDGYSASKLYKIEGVYNPKIIEIKEGKYPLFTITVAHGTAGNRKTESFQFKGE